MSAQQFRNGCLSAGLRVSVTLSRTIQIGETDADVNKMKKVAELPDDKITEIESMFGPINFNHALYRRPEYQVSTGRANLLHIVQPHLLQDTIGRFANPTLDLQARMSGGRKTIDTRDVDRLIATGTEITTWGVGTPVNGMTNEQMFDLWTNVAAEAKYWSVQGNAPPTPIPTAKWDRVVCLYLKARDIQLWNFGGRTG
ncbi:MAG: hypothetical protein Q9195_005170 [Heterodermia aff. obscurata]